MCDFFSESIFQQLQHVVQLEHHIPLRHSNQQHQQPVIRIRFIRLHHPDWRFSMSQSLLRLSNNRHQPDEVPLDGLSPESSTGQTPAAHRGTVVSRLIFSAETFPDDEIKKNTIHVKMLCTSLRNLIKHVSKTIVC